MKRGIHSARMEVGRDRNGAFRGWAGEVAWIDRRIEALSMVEGCCFLYGVVRVGPESLDERQQARVAARVGRLAKLPPQLERLDF